MRIAILFRGAMSKVGGKIHKVEDTDRQDEYVNFDCVKNSIQKHIIDCNASDEFDIFIHSWNEDLKDDLIKLYSPKKYIFESNEIYTSLIINKLRYCNVNYEWFAQVSQLLSLYRVCLMLNDTPVDYDKIIIYRPDLFLWKDMKMQNYDVTSKVYVNNFAYGKGDFHFVMNHENAIKFGKMFDHISPNLQPLQHEYINKYVQNILKAELIEDNIVAGEDQEIVRKLNNIVQAGIISENRLNEYGITLKEIETYNAN